MPNPSSYPLAWPDGWRRNKPSDRKKAAFTQNGAPIGPVEAAARLERELTRLWASNVVVSTNIQLRIGGARHSAPVDPGAAVYFTIGRGDGSSVVLACDTWDTVGGNLAALAKHIEAMRGMARWGVGELEQAFTAYLALPAPPTWRQLLEDPRSLAEAERTFRDLMRKAHPDVGGSAVDAARLTEAIATARKELV